MTHVKGTIYLIHFESPLAHAKHYLGWTNNLEKRLIRHKNGNGSALMRAVKKAGIDWTLVRVWEGKDRFFERALKNRKNTPKLCPICKGKYQ
jgi:predicted GIY-YIG superfamily endonuclease